MKFQEFYQKFSSKYFGKVQLFLTDPPYNVLNKPRDDFPQGCMELLIQMAESFLAKGGTLLLFCSIDQIPFYKQYLLKTILKVELLILNLINEEKCKFIFYLIVWKKTDMMPFMRNMVSYVIVAHKNDENGKFYWDKKVLIKILIKIGKVKIFDQFYIT
jgi:hypothetical protein